MVGNILLDDKRHRQDCGGAYLEQRLTQYGGSGGLLDVIYGAAGGERIEHADAHLIRMGQRQYGQEDIFAPIHFVCIPCFQHVVTEVAVTQHHAFGVAGGARCVDDGGYIGGAAISVASGTLLRPSQV